MPKVSPDSEWTQLDWSRIGFPIPTRANKLIALRHWLRIYCRDGGAGTAWNRLREIEEMDRATFDLRSRITLYNIAPNECYSTKEAEVRGGVDNISVLFKEALKTSLLFCYSMGFQAIPEQQIGGTSYFACARSNRRAAPTRDSAYLINVFNPEIGEIALAESLLASDTGNALSALGNGRKVNTIKLIRLSRGEVGPEAPNPLNLSYNPLGALTPSQLVKAQDSAEKLDALIDELAGRP